MRFTPLRIVLLVSLSIALGLSVFVGLRLFSLKEQLLGLKKDLDAELSVDSVSYDPFSSSITAHNLVLTNLNPAWPWQRAEVTEVRATYSLLDIFKPHLPITLHLSDWNVKVRQPLELSDGGTPMDTTTTTPVSSPSPGSDTPPSSSDSENPTQKPAHSGIRVTEIFAENGDIVDELSPSLSLALSGISASAREDAPDDWSGQFKIKLVNIDAVSLTEMFGVLHIQPKSLQISAVQASTNPGKIAGDCTITHATRSAQINADLVGVPIGPFLPEDWRSKFSGEATGKVDLFCSPHHVKSTGQIALADAKCDLFPAIDQVMQKVGMSSLVNFDHVTTNYELTDGNLALSKLDLRKKDVARVFGYVQIAADRQLNGDVLIGFPSSYTSQIPSLEKDIFTIDQENHHWAKVHLSGTLDSPTEDLSARLSQYTQKQGTDLINSAAQKAVNWLFGK